MFWMLIQGVVFAAGFIVTVRAFARRPPQGLVDETERWSKLRRKP